MPGPATSTLYDLARAALNSIVAHWPVDAEPLPDIQYVSNGLLAADGCDMLAVQVERTFSTEADPGVEGLFVLGPGFTNRAVVLKCTMLRCVPVIDTDDAGNVTYIPTPTEIETSAVVVLYDSQAMFNALVAGQANDELGGCQSMAFESWTSEGPEGGIGGGSLRVRMMVM